MATTFYIPSSDTSSASLTSLKNRTAILTSDVAGLKVSRTVDEAAIDALEAADVEFDTDVLELTNVLDTTAATQASILSTLAGYGSYFSTNSIDSVGSSLTIGAAAGTSTVSLATGTGVQTVNIGTGAGATTINIGGAGDTVAIAGSLATINVTNVDVADKLVRLNKGGLASSGFTTGLEVEEAGSAAGYVRTAADRLAWELKAPGSATVMKINQSLLTTDNPTFASITAALTGYSSTTGTLAATDTLVQGISKLNGNLTALGTVVGTPQNGNVANQIVKRDASGNFSAAAIFATLVGNCVGRADTVTTNANLTGGVTSVGNAATVVTNANLTGDVTSVGNVTTLQNATVISKLLTGYTPSIGSLSATDSMLTAFGKLGGLLRASGTSMFMGENAGYTGAAASMPGNIGIGFQNSYYLLYGGHNIGMGSASHSALVSGSDNIGLGTESGYTNVSGNRNIAIGSQSLKLNTESNLVAVGYEALRNNSTGTSCTAVGYQALKANTTSPSSTAVGYQAGLTCTGYDNTMLGASSGGGLTSGTQNTLIGCSSSVNPGTLNNCVAIGYNSQCTASNQVKLGNASTTDVVTAGGLTTGGKVVAPTLQMTTSPGAGKLMKSDASGNCSWDAAYVDLAGAIVAQGFTPSSYLADVKGRIEYCCSTTLTGTWSINASNPTVNQKVRLDRVGDTVTLSIEAFNHNFGTTGTNTGIDFSVTIPAWAHPLGEIYNGAVMSSCVQAFSNGVSLADGNVVVDSTRHVTIRRLAGNFTGFCGISMGFSMTYIADPLLGD